MPIEPIVAEPTKTIVTPIPGAFDAPKEALNAPKEPSVSSVESSQSAETATSAPSGETTVLTSENKVDEQKTPEASVAEAGLYAIKLSSDGEVTEVAGIKMPEEAERSLDKDQIEKLVTYAKDQKLKPEETQRILDRANAVVYENEQAQEALLAERRVAWRKEAMEDSEIGGAKFGENSELARRVIDRFAPPALKKALSDTGLGNYTPLIQFVVRIARVMEPDRFVPGDSRPASTPLSEVERMYGRQPRMS
ncbi:MAG TPA: hypothetical protein VI958_05585 [Acidobacteriota bacterium]